MLLVIPIVSIATEIDLDEIEPWNFPVSKEVVADANNVLFLVNDEHMLDERYKHDDMIYAKVRLSGTDPILIRRDVNAALVSLFSAAEADGIYLYLSSGYREYARQRANYYNNLQRLGYDDKSVQQAGASEHQTGLCADVISRDWFGMHLDGEFAKTPHGMWIAEHCAEHGFIVRYPLGKEEITGITFEPWHIRYVGVEAARFITKNEITLEEFWEWFDVYLAER